MADTSLPGLVCDCQRYSWMEPSAPPAHEHGLYCPLGYLVVDAEAVDAVRERGAPLQDVLAAKWLRVSTLEDAKAIAKSQAQAGRCSMLVLEVKVVPAAGWGIGFGHDE